MATRRIKFCAQDGDMGYPCEAELVLDGDHPGSKVTLVLMGGEIAEGTVERDQDDRPIVWWKNAPLPVTFSEANEALRAGLADPATSIPHIIVYTSAPERYDGFSTTTIAVVGRDVKRDLPVRKVAIEDRDIQWQLGRYGSGMCPFTHDRKTLEDYVRFGDWTLNA